MVADEVAGRRSPWLFGDSIARCHNIVFDWRIPMIRTCSRVGLAVLLTAAWSVAQRGAPIPQQLAFTPYQTTGIYGVGDTVGWTVIPGPVEPTYAYKWTIRRNNAVVLKEGKLDLSSGKDTIEITGDEPEMIYVAIEPVAKLVADDAAPQANAATNTGPGRGNSTGFVGGNTGRNNGLYAVGAAVAPTRIGLAAPRPADFDAFWSQKLAAQAKVPIHPVLTPAETDTPGTEMNTFVLDALGSHVQGCVAKPMKEGKFPALVLLQYAGVYALNARSVATRAAEGWLVIDVDSHDKLPSDPSGSVPRNYAAVGNTDRDTSYFLNMYLRDSRALDYLMTRPDWDGKTLVLMGTSMGGQQSLVLAGLRPEKITAVLVCVPSGTDANGDVHGRKAGYPNWPSNDPKVMNTALYFDPINFASRIQAPVLAAMGFIDTTSPPAGIWTALNQIPGAKEALPMIESEHNNLTPQKEQNWDARSKELLGVLLNGGEFKPNELK
jgi:cephalosporin-C deacetylase